MKVLHINCNYITTPLHQFLIRNLTSLGIENQVYSQVCHRANSTIKPDNNVIVSECFNKHDRYIFYYKQWKIIKDIQKHYCFSDFDCIHAYTLFTDGNTAMNISKKYCIPYVVAVRDTDVNTFFKKAFWLRSKGIEILKNASKVFFLSQPYREFVINTYVPNNLKNSLRKKSLVIPNGIDRFWLDNKYYDKQYARTLERISKQKLNLIFVGALSNRKNVITTVKAVDLLKKKGWDIRLTVIGKAEDRKQLEAVINSPDTKYLGPKTKEEIITLFRNSDIFVMPSITETFGLVYAEAMTQGLPVIYSRGQGFDGNFSDGEVGYNVNCYSAEEIAEKLVLISANYAEISNNCLNACGVFNWETIARRYLSVYKALIFGGSINDD